MVLVAEYAQAVENSRKSRWGSIIAEAAAQRAFDAASTQALRWAQSGRSFGVFILAEIIARTDGHDR
jgi:hypothetical protein